MTTTIDHPTAAPPFQPILPLFSPEPAAAVPAVPEPEPTPEPDYPLPKPSNDPCQVPGCAELAMWPLCICRYHSYLSDELSDDRYQERYFSDRAYYGAAQWFQTASVIAAQFGPPGPYDYM